MAVNADKTDDYFSDKDLETGLPSPDVSDDEEIQTSQEAGIIVSHFCNKLREQTRPLLSLSQGIPSPTKQLRENGNDKPKESKAKKRLFKGRQQPSNGAIEQRYGYVPNPRWPKSSVPQTRSFQPIGVEDNDREGVPGIMFKNSKTSGRQTTISEHSYQECDFPELNVSGLNGSSSSEKSLYGHLTFDEKSKNNSRRSMDEAALTGSTSPVIKNEKQTISHFDSIDRSCKTSTPLHQMQVSKQPSPTSLGYSVEQVSSGADSLNLTHNPAKYVQRTFNWSQGDTPKEGSLCSTAIGNFSRNRSKVKVCPSPDTDDQQSFKSINSCEDSSVDPNTSMLNSGKNLSWPQHACKSSDLFTITRNEAHGTVEDNFPRLHGQSDINCNCDNSRTSPGTWSNVVRGQSPLAMSSPAQNTRKKTVWDSSVKQGNKHRRQSDEKSSLRSIIASHGSPASGSNLPETASVHSSSPTDSHTNQASTVSSIQPLSKKNVPRQDEDMTSLNHGTIQQKNSLSSHSSPLLETSHESSENHIPQETEKSQRGKGSTRSRNKKSRNGNREVVGEKQSPTDNRSVQNKNLNGNHRRHPRSGPSALTLESFMTPQKNMNNKAGSHSGKKDLNMLRSRFVKEIEANPISPPKKVRPSPIKRLTFTAEETNMQQKFVVSDAGDAKETWQEQCERLQNLKQVINKKVYTTRSGDSFSQASAKEYVKAKQQDFTSSTVDSIAPVFSLERFINSSSPLVKDVFEKEDEDEYVEDLRDKVADVFWQSKSETKRIPLSLPTRHKPTSPNNMKGDGQEEDEMCITPMARKLKHWRLNTEAGESVIIDGIEQADPAKVTYKSILKKYSRRYCYFVEEHQVPNIAVELYFLVQLLTCTEVDRCLLKIIEDQYGGTYFHSVHNGVYFAVTVIKRLRRLFVQLGRTYLELLAASPRVQTFSPKLHQYFFKALKDKPARDANMKPQTEHPTFDPLEDGTMSFPDPSFAHVFKCQRENFYAFYGHYHDTNSAYEFRIENQIQYIFDGCTPEQTSLANLMHLAKLFLDHMILCCVKQGKEAVDVLKMIQCKGDDEKLFTKLYEAFFKLSSEQSGSACPSPGFTNNQMFFKDFIETLSCPSFSEHLRNLVVLKILELNSQNFSSLTNLHSSPLVKDDEVPLRNEKFCETVHTLCVLGKLLGYLTFSPYNSGTQPLPLNEASVLLTMREMTPLPLPLPLLLKQAFNEGHLCLTVPWIVEYLAMMDQMAPQLTVYGALLKRLRYIQMFAWERLYKEGHNNSGLLLVSCISWLFETPPVPAGFFFSCDVTREEVSDADFEADPFHVDRQKLVSQQLLSTCCPYLDQGQVLLTLFSLKQKPVSAERNVMPLSIPEPSEVAGASMTSQADISELTEWLGSSLAHDKVQKSSTEKKPLTVLDDEIVPAYVLTRLISMKDTDELEDVELHFMQSNPNLKSTIETAVDLICSKVVDYTHRMILKLLVFDAKVEVRKQFFGLSAETDPAVVRDEIFAQVNLKANRFSEVARQNFSDMCEKVCEKELSNLLQFLMSNHGSDIRSCAAHVARKMMFQRLQEWANVQLGPGLFKRTIVREAEKCARVNPKNLTLYPSDYTRKSDELSTPDMDSGFADIQQLSELIDRALSYGVWYVNALSPGTRPDSSHMIQLIQDFTACVEKKMIPMDFAFYVMSNFLMHLIIQYMVDAPQNWTEEAVDAFIKLCHLCKERNQDHDKVVVRIPDVMRKKKCMKIRVLNLMSVHAVQWLTNSEIMNETLMTYCMLICRLVKSELLFIESVVRKLVHTRDNRKLNSSAKKMVNRILLKVLAMLHEEDSITNARSFSHERIASLVEELAIPVSSTDKSEWDEILQDLAVGLENTFGCRVDVKESENNTSQSKEP